MRIRLHGALFIIVISLCIWKYSSSPSHHIEHASTFVEHIQVQFQYEPRVYLSEYAIRPLSSRFIVRLQETVSRVFDRTQQLAIMTSLSSQYADMTLNWLLNLAVFGLHRNVVLIAEDQLSFDILENFGFGNQTILSDLGQEMIQGKNTAYGRAEYWSYTEMRPAYVAAAWEVGVEVLWMDQDIFLFRHFLEYLEKMRPYDLLTITEDESFDNRVEMICSGIVSFPQTQRAASLLRQWQKNMFLRKSNGGDGSNQKSLVQTLKPFYFGYRRQFASGIKVINGSEGCSGLKVWVHKNCPAENVLFAHNNWVIGRRIKTLRFAVNKMWLLPCSSSRTRMPSTRLIQHYQNKYGVSQSIVAKANQISSRASRLLPDCSFWNRLS